MIWFFAASSPSRAQVVGATLSGTVTDDTGALLANTKLSIKDVATGVARDTVSDSSGFYTVPNLLPGTYEVTASAAGFSTLIRAGIVLTVGAQQVLNLSMQVGGITQEIRVTAQAPTVELSSSSLSNEVDANTIRELPLNGRDWTQLATLQPGVASAQSLQPSISSRPNVRGNRGFGAQLSISGSRPSQNNFRIDGISILDYVNNIPGDPFGASLGVDAIQEFSVVTSNYAAEYGRTAGGVINAVTRSGTNQFHGSAYEFLRNSALDARNYFDGAKIPSFRRNEFGVSAGLPIRRDKTFIFGDYEGLRQSLGVTGRPIVPSVDARNGIIHNSNGTTTTIKVDPKVVPYLALYGLPNAGLVGTGNTGIYSFVSQQVGTEDFVATRFDHYFSDKDSAFVTYQFNSAVVTLPDALNTVLVQQKTSNQHIALEETHIFSPQVVNTVRFGFNRVFDIGGGGLSAINPAAADASLAVIGGLDAPQITVSGLTAFNSGVHGQARTVVPWNTFQLYDDANLTIGKHSLKFGLNLERDQENGTRSVFAGGQFTFGSLNAFLLNQPTLFQTSPDRTRYFRETIFGAYIQDDIHLRRNITLNVGMRYEMSRVPTETRNWLTHISRITDTVPQIGSPLFNNPTLKNFAPRVGFAWDPFGNGRTSIRSGFGIFDVLPLLYEYNINQSVAYPFTIQRLNTQLPTGSFPTLAAALAAANPLQSAQLIDPLKRNYTMQWNLSVQRELLPSLTLMVAYVGSQGVHNEFNPNDVNIVPPTLTSAGYLWPNPATNPKKINPSWGPIQAYFWNMISTYHALEVEVTKQMSHGLQIGGSYTWGKSMDGGSGTSLPNEYSNSLANYFAFDSRLNHAVSDYNVKNNVVINGMWTAPKLQMHNRLADWTLGRWQLGGIFQARTGLPFTPLIGGDPLGTQALVGLDFPIRLAGPGCSSAVNHGSINYIKTSCFALPTPTAPVASQCVAFSTVPGTCRNLMGNSKRNALIGPGLANLDVSLFKNNYIGHSERLNAQFRAEFFNVLNRSNFNPPTDNLNLFGADGSVTGGAGLIDSTSTTSRQIQLALKLMW